MTKEELMDLLHYPAQTGQVVDKLHSLIDEYPYFHTGHQLYLKGLWQIDEKRMALQLKRTALCVRNRDVLYHYINHPSPQINIHSVRSDPAQPNEDKQAFSQALTISVENAAFVDPITSVEIREVYSEKQLVEDLIRSTHGKTCLSETLPQNNPAKDEKKENNTKADEDRTWSPSELIDYFLKTNPKIVPNNKQYEDVDLSEILQDSTNSATETLADIYATQGHVSKAIEIYEQLILKNPEKHIYFAAQIERLKK